MSQHRIEQIRPGHERCCLRKGVITLPESKLTAYCAGKLLTQMDAGQIFCKPCSSPPQRIPLRPLPACWPHSPNLDGNVPRAAIWTVWTTTWLHSATSVPCARIRVSGNLIPLTISRPRPSRSLLLQRRLASMRCSLQIWNRPLKRHSPRYWFVQSQRQNPRPSMTIRRPMIGI